MLDDYFSKQMNSFLDINVVRQVNNAIYQIVIFSNFLNTFSNR